VVNTIRGGATSWVSLKLIIEHMFSASPDPYQPSQQRDLTKARRIVQDSDPPAVADRHYSTCRAGHL
jgi:hypothetical protein